MAGSISRGRGGVSRALNARTLMTLMCSATVIAGCDRDAPTGLDAVEKPPLRVVEIAGPATSAYDSGINRNDTWLEQTQTVAETTTVTSSESFDDPNTGEPTYTTTVGSEPQTVNVSAGYGYDGQPRFTTGFQQTSGEETIWVQRVTDFTADRRSDGSDTQAIRFDPMNELGSLYGARLDYAADGGGASGGDACTQITGCAALRATDPTTEDIVLRPFGTSGPAFTKSRHSVLLKVVVAANRVRISERVTPPTRAGAGLMAYASANGLSAAAQSATKTDHRLTREYEKRDDGEWQLNHLMDETFVETEQTKLRLALHLTVVQEKHHRNKEKDEERARAKPRQQSDSVTGTSLRSSAATSGDCNPDTAIISCSTETLPAYTAEPPHVDPTSVVTTSSWRSGTGDGPPVVLQHGFLSSGVTWKRMDYWLSRDIPDVGVLRPTIPWRASYENQAGALHDTIAAKIGGRAAILIGHSNGGMVSRYLGRHPDAWNAYPTANIGAVVTVGSPHYGAPAARAARNLNRLINVGGFAAFLICRYTDTAGCDSWAHVASSKVPTFIDALTMNVPVLSQMQASDAYHQNFNGEYEGFRRYGISSVIWTRWMPWRLYGDSQCYPESGCGGAAEVRKIDRVYKRDITCLVIGAFLGRIDSIVRCTADILFLRGVDELYRRWVGMGGDGIVPEWSQKYPFIPAEDRYVVAGKNAPSHLGETQSQNVGNRVERILVSRLGLRGNVALPQ